MRRLRRHARHANANHAVHASAPVGRSRRPQGCLPREGQQRAEQNLLPPSRLQAKRAAQQPLAYTNTARRDEGASCPTANIRPRPPRPYAKSVTASLVTRCCV